MRGRASWSRTWEALQLPRSAWRGQGSGADDSQCNLTGPRLGGPDDRGAARRLCARVTLAPRARRARAQVDSADRLGVEGRGAAIHTAPDPDSRGDVASAHRLPP